jgi:hypothetical protein
MGKTWRREKFNDEDEGGFSRPSSFKISAEEDAKNKVRGKDYKLSGILSDDYKPAYKTTINGVEIEEKEEVKNDKD